MIFFRFLVIALKQKNFLIISIQDTLTLSLLWRLKLIKSFPFLDVLIDNSQNILKTSTYHKSTYFGLLLNYTSFTSRFYKIGLMKCLIDRAYKINNTWPGFYDDVFKFKDVLKRNSYPLLF